MINDWVTGVVEKFGEWGVGVLIVLENLIPPIPSEVVLPFAGYYVQMGELNVLLTWMAATAGSVLGALVLYGLAARLGWERMDALSRKRWFIFASEADMRRGARSFERYGWWVIGFGRCVPFFRSAVSLPAGLSRLPLWKFSLVTAVGSGVWNALFIWLGMRLGEDWSTASQYLAPVGRVVSVFAAAVAVWLVVRHYRRRSPIQNLP